MKHIRKMMQLRFAFCPSSILICISVLVLSSCARIWYGNSTKIALDSPLNDRPVSLMAIGKNNTYYYENISLPYKMKVRHKDIPLRLFAYADSVEYQPVSINGKKGGEFESELWWVFGGIFSAVGSGLGIANICGAAGEKSPEVRAVFGATAAAGAVMMGLGAWTNFKVPYQKRYTLQVSDLNFNNPMSNTPQYKALQIRKDIYDLISINQYKLALIETNYLINCLSAQNAELHYLRGVSLYHLGNYKHAITEFETAKNLYTDRDEFYDRIYKYLEAAYTGRANQIEKRQQLWLGITQAALQVTSDLIEIQQKYASANQIQAIGGTSGTNAVDQIPYVLRPEYAVQFCEPTYSYDNYGNPMVSFPKWAEYEGQMNKAVQDKVASASQNLMATGDSYYVARAQSLQAAAQSNDWMTKLDQQIWNTPMYLEAFKESGSTSKDWENDVSKPASSTSSKKCMKLTPSDDAHCNGNGICSKCNGRKWYNEVWGKVDPCTVCKGSGKCPSCGGTGYR